MRKLGRTQTLKFNQGNRRRLSPAPQLCSPLWQMKHRSPDLQHLPGGLSHSPFHLVLHLSAQVTQLEDSERVTHKQQKPEVLFCLLCNAMLTVVRTAPAQTSECSAVSSWQGRKRSPALAIAAQHWSLQPVL